MQASLYTHHGSLVFHDHNDHVCTLTTVLQAFKELSMTSPCITPCSSGLSCVKPEDVLQCIQGELKRLVYRSLLVSIALTVRVFKCTTSEA